MFFQIMTKPTIKVETRYICVFVQSYLIKPIFTIGDWLEIMPGTNSPPLVLVRL